MLKATGKRVTEEEDDFCEESLQEMELARLQRQLRIMEGDRKAYQEKSVFIIKKQNAEINALTKENEEINKDLMQALSDKKCAQDMYNTEQLQLLIQSTDDYKALVDGEKLKIAQMDAQIRAMEEKICHQRMTMGGLYNSATKANATSKRLRVLENRLDKAMVNLNKQLATNAKLREEIDHLRQERAVFDNLHKKLSAELQQSKDKVMEIIAEATAAYDSRDDANNKMLSLQERTERDEAHYHVEMKDLQRMIKNDESLREFMTIKDHDRMEYKLMEMAKKKKMACDVFVSDVLGVMQQAQKTSTQILNKFKEWENTVSKGLDADKAIAQNQEKIKTYEEAFERIKTATGEQDIDVIVKQFIEKEGENFALFNYANEVNHEVELLNEEISAIKEDINRFKSEEATVDNSREKMLKELQISIQKATAQTEKSQQRLKEVNKSMENLRQQIGAMFSSTGCDDKPIREMLGAGVGITDSNVMMYLGLIEQRTNEVLAVKEYLEMKEQGIIPPPSAAAQAAPVAVPKPTKPSLSNVVLPRGDSDTEEEEEDVRPLNPDEIRARVLKAMDKRMAEAASLEVEQPRTGSKTPTKTGTKKRV
ncbi:coiled-coil domain-containing protein 63-like [Lingula anatina]|uniref:Coiled-coil domain-containing protein 63 isoform X1 n=1 Tax=Lingula anatina TaxID=7574 RepID=A0A1S3HC43_LINAN|nr:coiled-coil domain-containing protein 63 isoform X1 [Lingula anatina]XP_023930577.1 coiled-coil domain-containing protein 63-like [Lingula anatina]|eukprot:XP_013383597.1 coiled-coil domain-containing protein 63 isoform X1 [Lingula anatina]